MPELLLIDTDVIIDYLRGLPDAVAYIEGCLRALRSAHGLWRANVYRINYDDGRSTSWDWARVGPSFHEFRKFGTVVFE